MVRFVRVLVFLLFATALALPIWKATTVESQSATEAPTGMDTLTNGLVTQAVHDGDRVGHIGGVMNVQAHRYRILDAVTIVPLALQSHIASRLPGGFYGFTVDLHAGALGRPGWNAPAITTVAATLCRQL